MSLPALCDSRRERSVSAEGLQATRSRAAGHPGWRDRGYEAKRARRRRWVRDRLSAPGCKRGRAEPNFERSWMNDLDSVKGPSSPVPLRHARTAVPSTCTRIVIRGGDAAAGIGIGIGIGSGRSLLRSSENAHSDNI